VPNHHAIGILFAGVPLNIKDADGMMVRHVVFVY
jgi:kynurenine formamidase